MLLRCEFMCADLNLLCKNLSILVAFMNHQIQIIVKLPFSVGVGLITWLVQPPDVLTLCLIVCNTLECCVYFVLDDNDLPDLTCQIDTNLQPPQQLNCLSAPPWTSHARHFCRHYIRKSDTLQPRLQKLNKIFPLQIWLDVKAPKAPWWNISATKVKTHWVIHI